MPIHLVFALICLAAAGWCAIRVVRLLFGRRATAATVLATSYGEAERLAARKAHPFDWLYKVTAGNLKPVVEDVLTITYEVDGRAYRQDVVTGHLRGDKARSVRMVWYDPDDPEQITIDDPTRPRGWCLSGWPWPLTPPGLTRRQRDRWERAPAQSCVVTG